MESECSSDAGYVKMDVVLQLGPTLVWNKLLDACGSDM